MAVVISSETLWAARALLGIDQRKLAELSGLSVPTIQRMEASDGVIRGNVNSLMKLIDALERRRHRTDRRQARRAPAAAAACGSRRRDMAADRCALACVAALLAFGVASRSSLARVAGRHAARLWRLPARSSRAIWRRALRACSAAAPADSPTSRCRSACPGSARISASMRSSAFFLVVVNLGGAAASLFALGYGRHETRRSACCRSFRPSSPA